MKTILFQGDSITDCGRNREFERSLGDGYANLVASKLGYDRAGEFTYINKGVSGNRVVDVYSRIKVDIINLKPDYMSLLIGVNDVWHEIDAQNGVAAEKFEKILTMLLEEVKEALPNIKIMLLAPYVLKGTATDSTEDPDRWNVFSTEVEKHAKAVKRVAEKLGLQFVSLQDKFDAAAKRTGDTAIWTADGVHPAQPGHELIARAWIETFKEI